MKTDNLDRHTVTDATDLRSDAQLLELFIRQRDQAAFALLMQRHGPYVLGICRRVTSHTQDAEDVFQACFLELVRNAPSIARGNSVAAWLQTVAVRLARKARARRARQRQGEARSDMKEAANSHEEVSWREVRQVLDEELAELPQDLRAAVILCLFEGRTQEEAAQYLDVNARTLKDRVHRGRELLRHRLTRRGVTLAVMGALLSGGSVEAAVSATLQQVTLQGATALANHAALTGLVSPSVLGLTGSSTLLAGWGAIVAATVALVVSAGTFFVVWNRPASPASMQTIKRSFRGRNFDNTVFQWSPSAARNSIGLEEQGLRITLPAKNGPGVPTGIAMRHPVRGDFELEVTFEFLHVARPDVGWAAGATLYFFMDDDDRNGMWFGKMNERVRGPVFVIGQRVDQGEERITNFADSVTTVGETGIVRLRVVRKGQSFSLFAAEGETGEFQHLRTLEISSQDVQIVRFATDPAWNPNVEVDVRLLEFSIAAQQIVGYQQ
jgi:RNA polymerase sigma factor (sigma-70 family)